MKRVHVIALTVLLGAALVLIQPFIGGSAADDTPSNQRVPASWKTPEKILALPELNFFDGQVSTPSAGCVLPPANMISWWSGDGNANDIQGGNHGAQSGGVGFAAGKVGQAFDLNGSNGIISFGNPANLQLTSAVTAEAWIRPRTTFGDYRTVVSKWSQTTNSSWGLFVANNKVYGIVANSSGQVTDGIGGDIPFGASAAFSHVAMSYSATDGIRVYVNGVQVDSDVSIGNIRNGSDVVRVGNDSGLVGVRYFDGLIDEVSIYNRALTGSEI